jgi:hypothetical protein
MVHCPTCRSYHYYCDHPVVKLNDYGNGSYDLKVVGEERQEIYFANFSTPSTFTQIEMSS